MSTHMNPFHDAHSTSLSSLADHDWSVVSNRWNRGCDWNIDKVGRKWQILGDIGKAFPLFTTKTAAYDAGSHLVIAESHWRAREQWEREHKDESAIAKATGAA